VMYKVSDRLPVKTRHGHITSVPIYNSNPPSS